MSMDDERDIFDQESVDQTEALIEAALRGEPGGRTTGSTGSGLDLVASRLASALRLQVHPETATAHLQAIERVAGELRAFPPARRHARRALIAALVAVMMVGAGSTSALAAAQEAVPGDALYGLKRASEGWRLALTRSSEGKAAVHLRNADRRVAEMRAMLASGSDPADLHDDYEDAVGAAQEQATRAEHNGADVTALFAKIEDKLRRHLDRLGEIIAVAPDEAQEGLQRALDNAEEAQERLRDKREKESKEKNEKDDEENDDKGKGNNGRGSGGGDRKDGGNPSGTRSGDSGDSSGDDGDSSDGDPDSSDGDPDTSDEDPDTSDGDRDDEITSGESGGIYYSSGSASD